MAVASAGTPAARTLVISLEPHAAYPVVAQLLKQYFDIAFLMRKPQDLPVGDQQMVIAVVLNFVTYFIALVINNEVGNAALHAVIDIACMGLFLYVALAFTGKLARFPQAFGAICGANAVLQVAAIPILQLTPDTPAEDVSGLALLSHFVLLVWSLSLLAHVLRHTFNIRMVTSLGVAFMYFIFIVSLLDQILPATTDYADQVSMNQSVAAFLFHAV